MWLCKLVNICFYCSSKCSSKHFWQLWIKLVKNRKKSTEKMNKKIKKIISVIQLDIEVYKKPCTITYQIQWQYQWNYCFQRIQSGCLTTRPILSNHKSSLWLTCSARLAPPPYCMSMMPRCWLTSSYDTWQTYSRAIR